MPGRLWWIGWALAILIVLLPGFVPALQDMGWLNTAIIIAFTFAALAPLSLFQGDTVDAAVGQLAIFAALLVMAAVSAYFFRRRGKSYALHLIAFTTAIFLFAEAVVFGGCPKLGRGDDSCYWPGMFWDATVTAVEKL